MKKEKITIEKIDRLAELSALSFTDKEKKNLITQVEGILDMLNACGQVETTPIEHENTLSLDSLRSDECGQSMSSHEALRNAPKQRKGYFNVPKVVE